MTAYDPDKFALIGRVDDDAPALDTFVRFNGWVPVPIQVPIAVVRGQYEKLTDKELEDLANDVAAETTRRLDLK